MVNINDFHEAFTKAEEEICFAEMAISSLSSEENDDCISDNQPRGVVIPAINELRYAAKHISKMLQVGEESPQFQEQLQKAINHCVRARLDALRAIVLFLARDFYSFTGDYKKLRLPQEDREILNSHRKKIWDTLNAIARHRAECTDAEYEKTKEATKELYQIYEDTESRRGIYCQLMETVNRHDKSTLLQWIAGLIIAIIFFLLGKWF